MAYKIKFGPKQRLKWKEIFLSELEKVPRGTTISLSGGTESSIIVFGMAELGKTPKHSVTVTLDGCDTKDSYWAKQVSDHYGVKHQLVKLPRLKKKALMKDLSDPIHVINMYRSIDVLCCYAYRYMLERLKSKSITIGFYNSHYAAATKVMILYRQYLKGEVTLSQFKKAYDKIRDARIFNNPTNNYEIISNYIREKGFKVHLPLKSIPLLDYSKKFTFMDFHEVKGKFKKKIAIYEIFREHFDRVGNWGNMNSFHVNSQLKDYHTEILTANTPYKKVAAIYRQILLKPPLSFSIGD